MISGSIHTNTWHTNVFLGYKRIKVRFGTVHFQPWLEIEILVFQFLRGYAMQQIYLKQGGEAELV